MNIVSNVKYCKNTFLTYSEPATLGFEEEIVSLRINRDSRIIFSVPIKELQGYHVDLSRIFFFTDRKKYVVEFAEEARNQIVWAKRWPGAVRRGKKILRESDLSQWVEILTDHNVSKKLDIRKIVIVSIVTFIVVVGFITWLQVLRA